MKRIPLAAALALLLAASACARGSSGSAPAPGGPAAASPGSSAGGTGSGGGSATAPASALRWNEYDHEWTAPAREAWRNVRSLLITPHTPHHRGYDLVLAQGATAPLRAKLHYGDLYADLEGERVGCWVRPAQGSGWVHAGDAVTSTDGRVEIALPAALLAPGTHFVRWVVYGDLTTASSLVRVLDRSTRTILFDIDGTLTTDDEQMILAILGQITDRTYVPRMYADADWVAQQLALQGFKIVYVTARPYWLGDASREWLVSHALPLGPVFTSESSADTFRSDAARDYKRAKLLELQAAGYAFEYAFGNAESDIESYALAGIPVTRTYIIGPHAGGGGTIALGAYRDLMGALVPVR